MQRIGSRRIGPGLTERGKGQLFVGSQGPFNAYYELISSDSSDSSERHQVTGRVGAAPEDLSALTEQGNGRLGLRGDRSFTFDVCEVLPERHVVGMGFTGSADDRPVVVSVAGSIISTAPPPPEPYHAWEDLFEAEMSWLSEHGRSRICAAAREARVTFRRKREDPDRPSDGRLVSDSLSVEIFEHVFGAVADEFYRTNRLDEELCDQRLPEIVHQVLTLSDPEVWGPLSFAKTT